MREFFVGKSVFLVLLLLSHGLLSFASSVEQVSVTEMLKNSELVFEGTVISTHAHFIGSGPQVETDVTFQITDIIKGKRTESRIVLTFSGGTVGLYSHFVSGMYMPEYRERGVYFVESVQRKQVHPFYGWEQGHFLVKTTASGKHIVATRSGQPVLGLEAGEPARSNALSSGTASGVRTGGTNIDGAGALSLEEFKSALRFMSR